MRAGIKRAFNVIDFEIICRARKEGECCGSTAVMALQLGATLYVAHAGAQPECSTLHLHLHLLEQQLQKMLLYACSALWLCQRSLAMPALSAHASALCSSRLHLTQSAMIGLPPEECHIPLCHLTLELVLDLSEVIIDLTPAVMFTVEGLEDSHLRWIQSPTL